VLSARWAPEDAAGARATVDALARYCDRVILLGPAVEYQHPLPRTLVVATVAHDPSIVERDRSAEISRTDKLFAAALAGSSARYYSIYEAICPRDRCQVRDSRGMPVEFDTDHFTLNGATWVARQIRQSGVLGLPKLPVLSAGVTDN
jgi:hypothetical protein